MNLPVSLHLLFPSPPLNFCLQVTYILNENPLSRPHSTRIAKPSIISYKGGEMLDDPGGRPGNESEKVR